MRGFNRKDGKFRTNDLAVMAIDAPLRLEEFGRVITLFVVMPGKGQNLAGAELDAISATLAALFENVDRAPGNVNRFRIQWNAPELHQSFSHSS
jgi:hypothetical protein